MSLERTKNLNLHFKISTKNVHKVGCQPWESCNTEALKLDFFLNTQMETDVKWRNGVCILCISCRTKFAFKMFAHLSVLHVSTRGLTHLPIVTVSTWLRARCRNYNILALLH